MKPPYWQMLAALVALLLLWSWGLGRLPLFDWDEINFAEISREMWISGNFLQPTIDFLPFHEKPPLFAWLQLVAYRLLGVNELAARLPNVLCGGITLTVLYLAGRRASDHRFGCWVAAFLAGSLLPALYFRSGIIDPWFNLFILLSLLTLVRPGVPTFGGSLWSGLLLGLAVLTKGPVAALVVGLVCAVLLLVRKEQRGARTLRYCLVGLLSLLPAAGWLALVWRVDDGFFATEFFRYQWRLLVTEDSGHGGFPGYHVVVLLLGCFPASVFALPALFGRRRYAAATDGGMRILFWTVLILFSLVSTKIVHYSSLCYFPLAWFAARWVTETAREEVIPRWMRRLSLGIWSAYAAVALGTVTAAWYLAEWLPLLRDAELLARLQQPVDWPWYAIVPGLLLVGYLIVTGRASASAAGSARLQLLMMLAFSLTALPVFAPRIQVYTQGANEAFYRDRGKEEAYLTTYGFKSYIPVYYGRVPPATGGRGASFKLSGPVDRPVYFSVPLRMESEVNRYVSDAELLYRRGGFAFYRRPVPGD